MNLRTKRTGLILFLAFEAFSQDPVRPLIWLVVFLLLTHFVIVKGVKDGIEKSSKILMPVLFYSYYPACSVFIIFAKCGKGIRVPVKAGF